MTPECGEYPTEQELERVRLWPPDELRDAFAFVKSIGNYWPDGAFWQEAEVEKDGTRIYHISTGGWSGNEEIIEAMRENTILWMFTWQQSRRGGHFTFQIRKTQAQK